MNADFNSWSRKRKLVFLALLAHELTVCARGETYEAGTDGVLKPELLRRFNELMHRVTGSIRDHLLEKEAMPVSDVVEMIERFGAGQNLSAEMKAVFARSERITTKYADE